MEETVYNKTMAFSVVISSARPHTTEEDIRRVFGQLNLGELERVDMVKAQSRGIDCLKIFIHYASTNPSADTLRARLDDNDARQKDGEIVKPVRIVYNCTRDGREQYWQVYKTKTPAERLAGQAAARTTENFVPKIEM